MPTRGVNATKVFRLCLSAVDPPSHSPTPSRPVHYSHLISNTMKYGNIFGFNKAPPVKVSPWDTPPIRENRSRYLPTEHDGNTKLKLERIGKGLDYNIFVVSESDDPYFMVREHGSDLYFRAPGYHFATLRRTPPKKEHRFRYQPPGPWHFPNVIQYVPVPPPPPPEFLHPINDQQGISDLPYAGGG